MIPGFDGTLMEAIEAIGVYGVWLIIFLESCLVFFLPGDSLLFVAGFLASQGTFGIVALTLGSTIAAIAGNAVAYYIGIRWGRRWFSNPKNKLFNPRSLHSTELFYARHGSMAIVLARFVPAVRTFIPILAGISAMPYRKFFIYNVVGAILWCIGLPLMGYFLGQVIPADVMEKYLIAIVIAIILLSLTPAFIHYYHARKEAKKNPQPASDA